MESGIPGSLFMPGWGGAASSMGDVLWARLVNMPSLRVNTAPERS